MDRIASFCVDHTVLTPGVYVSRIDGDVTTYDLRLKRPNSGDYLKNAPIHTIEHLFATYARNCEHKDSVIYFGPMGCRTGFYFLTRALDNAAVLKIIKDGFKFIADFEGDIPGASAVECGNYLEHDLDGAKQIAKEYFKILEYVTVKNMNYESNGE